MNSDRDRILSEFIDAWNAGRRPDVDEFVDRAAEEDRGWLSDEIASFMLTGPTPRYDDAAIESIRAEPIVAEALARSRERAGLWATWLPSLRSRAKLSTAQLAEKLTGALELPADRAAKTEGYLEEMERGALDPRGVSQRVLEALAKLLGVSGDELAGAGDLGAWRAAPQQMFRAQPGAAETSREHLEVLADAFAAPGGEDWDEVDELFRGGR